MKEDLKDKVIKHFLEQQLQVEIEDYNIQGVVKEGEITRLKIDVMPKAYTDFIEVNFNLKLPNKSTDK